MKKLLASLLLLSSVTLAQQTATTTLDPTQVYSTGNLVLPTLSGTNNTPWVNGVYQDSLTCFAWGNPGYCGPNPIVTPGYNINFSFGMTDIYQVQAIANVLPNSGTGLRVNGYNFGFMAKNGNGWDNGQQDYLTAYVSFIGKDGKQAYYKSYDLNSKFDWTTFNYSDTFATPYASKDLNTVQYGFVGYDTNFWAGPYGPEVTNINFSLKYSVDPCAVNVLSSATCPGYMDALAKLAPAPIVDSTTTSSTSTTPTGTVTTTVTTDLLGPTVTVSSSPLPPPGSPPPPGPPPSGSPPPQQGPAPTTTSSSTSTASTTTKESSGSSGGSISLALSIISKNSERDAAGAAVAQSAMAQAQSAANQAQQEAASVASNAVANSMSANIVSASGQQSSGTGIKVNSTSNNSRSSSSIVVASVSTINTPGFVGPSMLSITQQSFEPVSNTVIVQQATPNTVATNPVSTGATQMIETYSLVPPSFLTDKSNPLTDIIEGKQTIPQNNTTTTTGPSVNKNTQDNEVAGGVDINKMALSPAGYGSYLNLALRDAAFYAPKEVYKNQRNVDNARALRTLTNDSKHREMVEMQYAR
jgi:hypothetical protein